MEISKSVVANAGTERTHVSKLPIFSVCRSAFARHSGTIAGPWARGLRKKREAEKSNSDFPASLETRQSRGFSVFDSLGGCRLTTTGRVTGNSWEGSFV